jgi:hypothetical protein
MTAGDPVSWLLIEPGWKVLDRHGAEIGTVGEVLGDKNADIFDGLAVSRGVLERSLYLPAEQVGTIEVGTVHADIGDAMLLDELVPRR